MDTCIQWKWLGTWAILTSESLCLMLAFQDSKSLLHIKLWKSQFFCTSNHLDFELAASSWPWCLMLMELLWSAVQLSCSVMCTGGRPMCVLVTQDEQEEDCRWSELGLPGVWVAQKTPCWVQQQLQRTCSVAKCQSCLHGRNKFGLGTTAAEK